MAAPGSPPALPAGQGARTVCAAALGAEAAGAILGEGTARSSWAKGVEKGEETSSSPTPLREGWRCVCAREPGAPALELDGWMDGWIDSIY